MAGLILRILVDEEKDSRERVLAIVRDSGMLITDRLGEHAHFQISAYGEFPRTWNGFTAVVECLSQDSRSLLREAEGTSHDKISADYADDDEEKGSQSGYQGSRQLDSAEDRKVGQAAGSRKIR